MKITTIELPIYNLDIIVIINDWQEANRKFKLQFREEDYEVCAWTIYDEPYIDNNEIFLLLRQPYLDNETILHELIHVISGICNRRGIVMDPTNDEPLAYLQGYIGNKILEFRDKQQTNEK